MTYARARLWLGISGVGLIVVITVTMIFADIPYLLLPKTEQWQAIDVLALFGFAVALIVVMLPFDLFGGYLLPKRFGRETTTLGTFCKRWSFAVATQTILFLTTGLAILAAGRLAGLAGALAIIGLVAMFYLAAQGTLARLFTKGKWSRNSRLLETASKAIDASELRMPLVVVDHTDAGFTGGVVGLPHRETLLIPRKWLNTLSAEQLGVAIARRIEAVRSGSRTRGLVVALAWILTGFTIAALLPGAGVRSVAGLVTTCCGFTCWTFLGLLILPTVSRRGSYGVDEQVLQRGISRENLDSTLAALDRLQDDEPQRPALIEAIFHPVPSVENRQSFSGGSAGGAWHVARMTLYLSWSCLGLLSRAVHCNAGRPELWVMLPTD